MRNYSKNPENVNLSSRLFNYSIPENLIIDTSLTGIDLRIYATIESFMKTTGTAYISNNWLAKRFNVHRATVIRSINCLVKKGYIVKKEKSGKRYLFTKINPVVN